MTLGMSDRNQAFAEGVAAAQAFAAAPQTKTCHGCDGRGWVAIVTETTILPLRTVIVRKPFECPVCKGKGQA